MQVQLLPLLLLTACAAPGPSAQLRPVGELPQEYRDTWVAWVERDPGWPAIRSRVLDDPQLTSFLVDNLARIMLRAYRGGAIVGAHDPGVGPFERARAELTRLGSASVPTLAELMAIGDGTASLLCGDVLVDIGAAALDYVPRLLERGAALERARGAELLGRLPHSGGGEADLLRTLGLCLLEDPDWAVRKASAVALGRRGSQHIELGPTRQTLSRALSDGDGDVSRAAVLALARLGDPLAVPALLNHLERAQRSADLVSYEAGQRALRALTGTRAAQTPREWRDWWRANRPAPRSGGNR